MASIKQEEEEKESSKFLDENDTNGNKINSSNVDTQSDRKRKTVEFLEDKELDNWIKEWSESEYKQFLLACRYNLVNPKNLDYQTFLQGKGYSDAEFVYKNRSIEKRG